MKAEISFDCLMNKEIKRMACFRGGEDFHIAP